jgi:uncharacterized surface protein with fasciclin (FAS1) repeats
MHSFLARGARFAAALSLFALTLTAAPAQETKPTDAATPEAAKPEAAKPEAAKPEAAKPDTAKAGDIVEVAKSSGKFNTLLKAIDAAGLTDTLKGAGPYTLFAPTDDAFAQVPKEELDALLANKEELKEVLLYHVVPGKLLAADVTKIQSAKTVQGDELTIEATADGILVDGAKVVQADIAASNGVIHAIDTVLLEEGEEGE